MLIVRTLCRLKPAAPLKNKVVLARKKGTSASPAVAPPTPPASKPSTKEEDAFASSSEPASTAQTRTSTTPASEWTALTGKTSLTPEEERAEATANDDPAFRPVKEEPFYDEGRRKDAFKTQFVPLPSRLSRQQPRPSPDGEPDEDRVYNMVEIVDILDETHQSFHEHFEEGVARLRKQMEVTIITIL